MGNYPEFLHKNSSCIANKNPWTKFTTKLGSEIFLTTPKCKVTELYEVRKAIFEPK